MMALRLRVNRKNLREAAASAGQQPQQQQQPPVPQRQSQQHQRRQERQLQEPTPPTHATPTLQLFEQRRVDQLPPVKVLPRYQWAAELQAAIATIKATQMVSVNRDQGTSDLEDASITAAPSPASPPLAPAPTAATFVAWDKVDKVLLRCKPLRLDGSASGRGGGGSGGAAADDGGREIDAGSERAPAGFWHVASWHHPAERKQKHKQKRSSKAKVEDDEGAAQGEFLGVSMGECRGVCHGCLR
jgi:hypothetical protein